MNISPKLSDNMRGITLMLLAMAGFAINDGFIKAVGNDLSIGQVLLIRGAFASIILFTVAKIFKQLAPIHLAFTPLLLLRASLESIATVTFIFALFNMPIANVTAILQALPLTVTAGAVLIFGDKIGIRRILAILCGLIGVLLIIRPGTDQFSLYSLSCIGTVFAATGRDLVSKRLDKSIPSPFVSLQTAIVVMLTGLVLCLFSEWRPVETDHVLLLASASVFLSLAYFGIVSTMRIGEVAIVSPFRYTVLLYSILIGMVAFGEFPDLYTWIGSAIIVATGIYTIYRERKSKPASHAK